MADSLHEQAIDAIVTVLKALELEAGMAERVHKKKLPDRANLLMPCLLVTYEDGRETVGPFSTEEDEWVFPVFLHLVSRKSQRDDRLIGQWLSWRQAVIAAFLMQLLPLPAGSWHVDVSPGEVLDTDQAIGPGYQLETGSLVLAVHVITARVRPSVA